MSTLDELLDLLDRSRRAELALNEMASSYPESSENVDEIRRLRARASGVRLVIGYIDEAVRKVADS